MIAKAVVAEYNKEFNDGQVDELDRTVKRLEADMNRLVDQLLVVPPEALPTIHERMKLIGAQKEEAETDLAKMKLAKNIQLTEAQVKSWLRTFQNGDLLDEEFRQKIIDVFINSIYLYDDKVVIFYNVKGGKQISAIDVIDALDEQVEGSDLSGYAPPFTDKSEPRLIFVHGLFGIVIRR